MTIFDLPNLDSAEALRLANATLDAHPVLRRIYDEEFIAERIRRKGGHDNVLLLYLVHPEDERAIEYWNGVADGLTTLEAEGSFDAFRAKLRKYDEPGMVSARTELFFAAWLKRQGIGITLEPQVGETRRCEFVAQTMPETWWEIKSPLDLKPLQHDDQVLTDVQRRLRTIEQPFVLNLQKTALMLDRVPAAVKAIEQQLHALHRDGGTLPQVLSADGLEVEVAATTQQPKGYLGTLWSEEYLFENEHADHVVKRVIEAAEQIPRRGGGVVVIDRTVSDWIHHDAVDEACFGRFGISISGNRWMNCRDRGVFDYAKVARISAIVSYTRKWIENDGTKMTVLHNPSARVPLPNSFLACDGVKHVRRVVDEQGFRFVTTPLDEDVAG